MDTEKTDKRIDEEFAAGPSPYEEAVELRVPQPKGEPDQTWYAVVEAVSAARSAAVALDRVSTEMRQAGITLTLALARAKTLSGMYERGELDAPEEK